MRERKEGSQGKGEKEWEWRRRKEGKGEKEWERRERKVREERSYMLRFFPYVL